VDLSRTPTRGRLLPGAVELPWARRRRLRAERGTVALGIVAFGLTATVLGAELVRFWRARTEQLAELDVADPAEVAMRETMAAAVVGYEHSPTGERALLNLLTSFSATFAVARASTYVIYRRGGGIGPLRNVLVGQRHIHHFVPGIVLAFVAGGASVISRNDRYDPLLAVPFGIGVALTLDESALLLRLDDVYWSEEGIVSVQITLAALALLSAAAIAARVLRRGERRVRGESDFAVRPPEPASDV
jgi:hypothetical protein